MHYSIQKEKYLGILHAPALQISPTMSQTGTNNKRIAKNTLMLYFRMLLLMGVTLYTSRVVLKVLGVEDFGLYSVVGSITTFLGFINTSMTAAAQRFLSYSKGKDSAEGQNKTFNSIFLSQTLITLLILVVGETLGTLYIQNFLNVAQERLPAAHIVFQCSLFAFLCKAISVPYTASIIANEHMSAYAKISIIEGLFLLLVVILLPFANTDKLICYAISMFVVTFSIQLCYRLYCRKYFSECHIKRNWDRKSIRKIFNYGGWNLLGAFSSVTIDQGVNIILNSFFGFIVNAALGIAFQISAAVSSLSGNFQQAINPQIVKSYACNDFTGMHSLIMKGTRLSFFMLFTLATPIMFNLEKVLCIWLGEVPPYTLLFCQLAIINSLITSFSGMLLTGAMATGNIKKYQIIVASINLMNLPLSWGCLYLYPNPYLTMYIMIGISIIAFCTRLYLVSELIHLSKIQFIKKVFVPIIKVCTLTLSILFLFYHYIEVPSGFIPLILFISLCLCVVLISIFLFGINQQERQMALTFIKKKTMRK